MEILQTQQKFTNSNLAMIIMGILTFRVFNSVKSMINGALRLLFKVETATAMYSSVVIDVLVGIGLIYLAAMILRKGSRQCLFNVTVEGLKKWGVGYIIILIGGPLASYFVLQDSVSEGLTNEFIEKMDFINLVSTVLFNFQILLLIILMFIILREIHVRQPKTERIND